MLVAAIFVLFSSRVEGVKQQAGAIVNNPYVSYLNPIPMTQMVHFSYLLKLNCVEHSFIDRRPVDSSFQFNPNCDMTAIDIGNST